MSTGTPTYHNQCIANPNLHHAEYAHAKRNGKSISDSGNPVPFEYEERAGIDSSPQNNSIAL